MELPFGDKLITETTMTEESINTAIAAMKAEVQTKERQLEEALNSLYLEHRLEINSHWMRLVSGKHLVLGLGLLCSCDNARDPCLQMVGGGDSDNSDSSVLEYQWSVSDWSV